MISLEGAWARPDVQNNWLDQSENKPEWCRTCLIRGHFNKGRTRYSVCVWGGGGGTYLHRITRIPQHVSGGRGGEGCTQHV